MLGFSPVRKLAIAWRISITERKATHKDVAFWENGDRSVSGLLIQIETFLGISSILTVKSMMLASWSSLTRPLPVPAHAKPARRENYRLRDYIKNSVLKIAMQSLSLFNPAT